MCLYVPGFQRQPEPEFHGWGTWGDVGGGGGYAGRGLREEGTWAGGVNGGTWGKGTSKFATIMDYNYILDKMFPL